LPTGRCAWPLPNGGPFAHGSGVLQCVRLGREWCRSGHAFAPAAARAGANAPVAEKCVADCQAHAACRRVMHGRRCVDEQLLARARKRCTSSCGLWRVRIRRPAHARADWACARRAQSATPSATATSWRPCWGGTCERRRCMATFRSSSERRAAARPHHAVLVYWVLVLYERGSLGEQLSSYGTSAGCASRHTVTLVRVPLAAAILCVAVEALLGWLTLSLCGCACGCASGQARGCD